MMHVTINDASKDFIPDLYGKAFDRRIIRAFDIVFASIALVLIAPVMLIVAVLILITDPGPVIFGHRRIGRHGQMFRCLKFRSMVVDADQRLMDLLANSEAARREWAESHKLRKDPRITPIGSFLRKSSLDELPQLFNVLRGEMSMVGPRPIVEGEIARYGRYYNDYCSQRPGVTGLWQISGRSDTSYRRRVALDIAFSRNRSASLYLRILFGTLPCILLQRGSC